MAVTKLADVIQPELFTGYVHNKTVERSALIQSGIVQHDAEFDALASGPNTIVNMPFWNDLTGDSEVIGEDESLTPKNITASKDIARKQARANAWGANGLSALLSGDDPLDRIADRVADYWIREKQKILLHTLKGVFAATSMADHKLDITARESAADQLVSGSGFVDATQLLGDAKDILTGVMMHSAVEAYLIKRQLIEYVEQTNELNQVIKIPYFMGKRVVVDDGMPFDPTSKVAEMYLFGQNAIAMGNGKHDRIVETEVARDSLASAGEDLLINRSIFIMHPRGIKWTEADVDKQFPSNAEIATGTNWERVFDKKQIRVVNFKFKIAD